MAITQRCHYEVLGVERLATDDELKKSYRKLALLWHPDKNQHQIAAATEAFKDIQAAYAVLSDPQERSWYDQHRDAILRGGTGVADSGGGDADADDDGLDLWRYFTSSAYSGHGDDARGFHAVFATAFADIDADEAQHHASSSGGGGEARRALPGFGGRRGGWEEVRGFYAAWEGFATCRSFAERDRYDVRAAPDRASRRAAEKANEKARRDARRRLNETVRTLVAYVKRRDVRVQRHVARAAREGRARAEKLRVERQAQRDETRRQQEQQSATAERDEEADAALDELIAAYGGDDAFLPSAAELEAVVPMVVAAAVEPVDKEQEEEDDDDDDEVAVETPRGEGEGGGGGPAAAAAAAAKPKKEKKGKKALEEERVAAAAATEARAAAAAAQRVEAEQEWGGGDDDDLMYGDGQGFGFRCELCAKRFTSLAQLRNHEQSKQHVRAVRTLRRQLEEEDRLYAEEERKEERKFAARVERVEAEAEVEAMSVRELKEALASGRVDHSRVLEKAELVELATRQTLKKQRDARRAEEIRQQAEAEAAGVPSRQQQPVWRPTGAEQKAAAKRANKRAAKKTAAAPAATQAVAASTDAPLLEVGEMRLGELRAELRLRGADVAGLLERDEFAEALLAARARDEAAAADQEGGEESGEEGGEESGEEGGEEGAEGAEAMARLLPTADGSTHKRPGGAAAAGVGAREADELFISLLGGEGVASQSAPSVAAAGAPSAEAPKPSAKEKAAARAAKKAAAAADAAAKSSLADADQWSDDDVGGPTGRSRGKKKGPRK